MPTVKVEERLRSFQALSPHARLANFVKALHALDGGRNLSAYDAPLGLLWSRVVSSPAFPLKLSI